MTSVITEKRISVYAELLSNLRQLSVVASLPSPSDSSTLAFLSEDGRVLTVSHQGQTQNLELPEQPLPSALHIPAQAAVEIAWRLRLPALEKRPERFTLEDQPLPWNARDILEGSPVTCRSCSKSLVEQDRITKWKDLPSDNWVEMMEFWHCHKPVDHSNPSQVAEGDGTATKKGYGANNIISAQQAVGLVDITSFVLSKFDCSAVVYSVSSPNLESNIDGLKIEDAGPTKFSSVLCKECTSEVGIYNMATEAVSLFKWSVRCETAMTGLDPSITECLAATIMSTISRSGSAKFVIAPHLIGSRNARLSGQRSLYVWVLNSNVVYATSQSPRRQRNSAMKLLFRSVSVDEGNAVVDAMNSDVQELTLPLTAIDAVTQALEASSRLLPPRERAYREWQVGLLQRWKPDTDT